MGIEVLVEALMVAQFKFVALTLSASPPGEAHFRVPSGGAAWDLAMT
jgi:hypothetical protein